MTINEAAVQGPGKAGSLPFDTGVAHQARIYDYVLGGKDNFAADRAAAEEWLKVDPGMAFSARENRAFLGRVVRYLTAEAGIRQFLDIGTGMPTAGNTHQVAQEIAPESRVVYVDYDPIVLAHARALLTSSEEGATEYIDADVRNIDVILTEAAQLLDFTKPVAVTLLAVLHTLPDADDPHAIVATVMDAVPPGSYLAISHTGAELLDRDKQDGLKAVAMRQRPNFRSREEIARFFEGTDVVEPGLVRVEEWRPEPGTEPRAKSIVWCAVGRKR